MWYGYILLHYRVVSTLWLLDVKYYARWAHFVFPCNESVLCLAIPTFWMCFIVLVIAKQVKYNTLNPKIQDLDPN